MYFYRETKCIVTLGESQINVGVRQGFLNEVSSIKV